MWIGVLSIAIVAGCGIDPTPPPTHVPVDYGTGGGPGGSGVGGATGTGGAGSTTPGGGTARFDADEIYAAGSLGSDSVLDYVVAPVNSPNSVNRYLKFQKWAGPSVRRNGSLIYVLRRDVGQELRTFASDSIDAEDPASNDPIIAVCETMNVTHISEDADTGDVIYACGNDTVPCSNSDDDCRYRRLSGEPVPVPMGYRLVAMGHGGYMLLTIGSGAIGAVGRRALKAPSEDPVPLDFSGLTNYAAHAWHVRVSETGFQIIFDRDPWGLWHVALDGETTLVDGYPTRIDGFSVVCRMVPNDDIFCWSAHSVPPSRQIHRYRPDAPEPVEIYSQAPGDSDSSIYAQHLFSGR
jgi:hypothetical protein